MSIRSALLMGLMLLATSSAAPPVKDEVAIANQEAVVLSILNEAEQLAITTAKALEHQLDEIVLSPLQQVDDALQAIEELRPEHEDCVAEHDEHIFQVVDTVHDQIAACGVVAARTSAKIVVDVNAALQQLIFDGIDVLTTYRRCKKYKNSVLKGACYSKLTIKVTLYTNNSRKSIRTIKQSTNERVPAVFNDADVCTHDAADQATAELVKIGDLIRSCA